MKVAHWTMASSSGMHRVATEVSEAENDLGLTSVLVDIGKPETWEAVEDADVHVAHTYFPSAMLGRFTKPRRIVSVFHGTPEHVFHEAAYEASHGGYGHGDPFMLMQHWLKEADARVTFWERHKWVYDQMIDQGARKADCIPLGVKTDFWGTGASMGKFVGEPSVLSAESPNWFKWPLDLALMMPDVMDAVPSVQLHLVGIWFDLHRMLMPLMHQNGSAFGSYVTNAHYDHNWLRNAFKSCDFYAGLVRYGDHNLLSLQANAAGCKTISYAGNPHSDFWLTEGDQRGMAKQLIAILSGDVEPRKKAPVPDIKTTASAMAEVYKGIL